MVQVLFMLALVTVSIFLIMLVLVQRGRGGGLAGAFGGMGGQSAFGAKAGDVFTRVTIGVATVWILLCILSVKVLSSHDGPLDDKLGGSAAPPAGQESIQRPATGDDPITDPVVPPGNTPASTGPSSSSPDDAPSEGAPAAPNN